jgi:hypothetical protein
MSHPFYRVEGIPGEETLAPWAGPAGDYQALEYRC